MYSFRSQPLLRKLTPAEEVVVLELLGKIDLSPTTKKPEAGDAAPRPAEGEAAVSRVLRQHISVES
eukprot:4209044-Lingulodinium_polyedra.AAC.1